MSEQTEARPAVTRCLETASVPYMISGSTAMNFYARPRMTRDIDIVTGLPVSEVSRLVDVLSKLLWSVDSGSDTQTIDVRNLLAAGELDEEYLTAWADRLGVGERLDALRP